MMHHLNNVVIMQTEQLGWIETLEGKLHVSGPLCHLVRSLQTERYSAEDILYQFLTPVGKLYPSHKDLY